MPDIEYLADMNISPLTVEKLRQKGLHVTRISEIMDSRTKDMDILDYARQHNKVIITQDLDFSMLLAVGNHSGPSVINIRMERVLPHLVAGRILDALPIISTHLKKGVVVSVDETSVRFRELPIGSE